MKLKQSVISKITDPREQMRALLLKHTPEQFVDYCFCLWRELGFSFTVTRARVSKAGDYRYHPVKNTHHITINHNLNLWSFLITYLHEVAHMQVRLKYTGQVRHHGPEWKKEFRGLLVPVIATNNLPEGLSRALARYARAPKASTYSDHHLLMELRKFDDQPGDTLAEVGAGENFSFNGKWYQLESKRRTRALCKSLENNKKYLISLAAIIDNKEN